MVSTKGMHKQRVLFYCLARDRALGIFWGRKVASIFDRQCLEMRLIQSVIFVFILRIFKGLF